MTKTAFIAICSEEYLGFYTQLFNSVKQYSPKSDNILYFISKLTPLRNPPLPTKYDQVVNITDWHDSTIYKDRLVSICSLRARVVLDAFNKGYDKVIFCGAKIEFFSDPWELLYELDFHDAVGTPHILEPLPDDGKFPSNASVSFTGHLSTDLVGFRNTEQIRKFLTWLDKQLATNCVTTGHTYLDQSWLNFLPFFCENVSIFKHLGTNVAYWNMYQREMKKENGVWRMKDGSPLVAFQYSGLDLDDPKSISRHQNRYTAEGDILEFLTDYARRVKSE